MSDPFIGEIRLVGFNFAPRGFANCDGQLLKINENQALFSILGTTYGGDGRTTFALPDLRGRVPIHAGDPDGPEPPTNPGQQGGSEEISLAANELPAHRHALKASGNQASSPDPDGNVLAGRAFLSQPFHSDSGPANAMRNGIIGNNAGGVPHNNMQPYTVIHYVIALVGFFPPRN